MNRDRGFVNESDTAEFLAAGFTPANILEVILGAAQKLMSKYTNHFAQTPIDPVFEKYAWQRSTAIANTVQRVARPIVTADHAAARVRAAVADDRVGVGARVAVRARGPVGGRGLGRVLVVASDRPAPLPSCRVWLRPRSSR